MSLKSQSMSLAERETPAQFSTDDAMWGAILRRDPRADGAFVYAVKTTGVYCRPTCPSRRPLRSNVRFFTHKEGAERAGYRACKRCKPALAGPPTQEREVILRACERIEQGDDPPALVGLAREARLSPGYFHRLFKKVVGVTPRAYAAAVRARRLQDGLARGGSVAGAIYRAGYGSSGRCYGETDAVLGMSPATYRAGAPGQVIHHAIVPCYLGWVLVAATERGLCMIEFADEPGALQERPRARFPNAVHRTDDPDFAVWVTETLAYLDAPKRGLALPLDIQGTAFQRRVWEALRTIPAGTKTTYSEVARQIGQPAAVRAVARACAANPVAVAIPCHRVVRSTGKVSGYRWGVDRKRALLEREAEHKGQ